MPLDASKPQIYVKFTQQGFHRWPSAPEHRSYLAYPHRHMFHVLVSCSVTHNDREVEFHDLMQAARTAFYDLRLDEQADECSSFSCEQMAQHVGQKLADAFGRAMLVDVSEDGECGAVVMTQPSTKKSPSECQGQVTKVASEL